MDIIIIADQSQPSQAPLGELHCSAITMPDTEYRDQSTEHKVPSTENKVQCTEHKVPSTKYRVQRREYRVKSSEYRVQSTKYRDAIVWTLPCH